MAWCIHLLAFGYEIAEKATIDVFTPGIDLLQVLFSGWLRLLEDPIESIEGTLRSSSELTNCW